MYIVLETHGGAAYAIVSMATDGENAVFETYEEAFDYANIQCQEGIVVEIY